MAMMSVEAAQAAVERACQEFMNPATQPQAEQVLLQFRRSPGVLPAARHILDASPSAEARFHAACALREAALREWASHAPAEREGLRAYALRYVLAHAGDARLSVVRSALTGAVAVLLKRAWGELTPEARAAFFVELDAAAAGAAAGVAARVAALQVLEAVVGEFGLATASALGLSWEYHEACRDALEGGGFLRGVFGHALEVARGAAAAVVAAGGPQGAPDAAAAAAAAMRLMAAVLGWEFRGGGGGAGSAGGGAQFASAAAAIAAGVPGSGGRKALPDSAQVKPGAAWSDALLAPATTDWLAGLLPVLQPPAAQGTPLAVAARQLVVAFCSLAGDVFPKAPPPTTAGSAPPPAAPETVRHVAAMLRLVLPWAAPAGPALEAAARGDEAQLLDACRALAALCAGHKVAVIDAAGAAAAAAAPGGLPHVFAALEGLACALLAAGGVSAAAAPEPWLPDAADMLLECWAALVAPHYGYAHAAMPPPHAAVEGATRVAAALVDAALADAAAGAADDADDDADAGAGALHQEEWLARAAVLLRAAPAASFARLAELLAAKQAELAAAAGSGADPSAALEQLHWLARAAAHALADSGAGEVPLPPEAVLLCVGDASLTAAGATTGAASHRLAQEGAAAAAAAGAAAVERLSRALLELTALCLSPAAAPVVSPRLMEACAWGAARWADTYLFPDDGEPLPEALAGAFGGDCGAAALDMLVRAAQRCLAGFPGEAELHRVVCRSLLPTLVRRRPLTRRLLQLPSWQELAGAFARREAALAVSLPQKLQRALAQSLCLAASGFADEPPARQYVSGLLAPAAGELVALAAQPPPQLAAAAQRADVQLRIACLLEVLRGAARGTLPLTFPALADAFGGLLGPLLALHGAFRHVAPVVALLLKLADDVVEHVAPHVEQPEQRERLLQWTLQLLAAYRDSNLWSVSLATAAALKAERAAEQVRDLRAVLSLLAHVTQSDLAASCGDDDDDGDGGGGGGGDEYNDAEAFGGPAGGGGGGERSNGSAGAAAAAAANGGHTHGSNGAAAAASAAALAAASSSPAARVVLLGLSIVLPLISAELLRFPKLALAYYGLLAHMLEAHPRAVAELPAGQFGALMASLEWALAGADAVAAHCALEGLAALARHHLGELRRGRRGLSGHAAAGGRSVPAHFQELLLRRLLLEDAPADVVELAADALLPLLMAEPSAFAPLSAAVAQAARAAAAGGAGNGGDQRAASAVAGALAQLGAWLQAHADATAAAPPAGPARSREAAARERLAARGFRHELTRMVADVRGLVRMR